MTITLGSLPWVRRAAIALGFVDTPSHRKAHRAPTPLLGVIMAGSFAAGTFTGPIDFGGGSIANAGGTAIFVVKFSQ